MPCKSALLGEEAREYIRELTEVLATQDLRQLREFYAHWEKPMGLPSMPDDERLEIDMHMMILELPGLQHLHATSQEWLLARGLAVDIRQVNCGKTGDTDSSNDCGSQIGGAGCGKEPPAANKKAR